MDNRNAQFVADIPKFYDRYLGPYLFEPYAREMAARAAAAKPKRVLEVACGTGVLTRQLHRALRDTARLAATDLNPPMLDQARSTLPGAAIEWRQADGASLPFPDGSFDLVVCQFGYMFFPDKVAGFRDARRVLARGGRLLFSVWNPLAVNPTGRIVSETVAAAITTDPPAFFHVPFSYHDERAIRADLAAAGFRDVAIDHVVFDSVFPSADDLATGLLRGTPMFVALTERGADIDALQREAARRFAALGGAAPCTLRLDGKVVTASSY